MSGIVKKSSGQIDMLNGPLLGRIMLFALPLALSSVLQQLFNAADVAVVGRFAGSEALAAVGSNTPIINLLVNLFVGISVGANVVISRYIGQNDARRISAAVHTAMVVAIVCGFVMGIVGIFAAMPILTLMDSPIDVRPLAALYLRIYFGGMPFVMVYNFGAAVLRSKGDTKRPLICLMVSGVINVILNLILVIVFHLGVAGVAIATVAANLVSSSMVVYFLLHEAEPVRLNPKKLRIHKQALLQMVRIGAPAGLQGMLFSFSNVVIQSAVNTFDTHGIAGSAAAFNFECFTYFFINAFTQAAVTFTSQNLGAGKTDRCRKIFSLTLVAAVISAMLCSSVLWLGREFFVQFFTTDPLDIDYAMRRTMFVAALSWIMTFYEIPGGALRGMGHSMLPAVLTMLGSCVFRLIWVQTVFSSVGTYESLMMVYPVSWALTGIAVTTAYFVIRRRVLNS